MPFRFHHNCCDREKRAHQKKMKIENKTGLGDYQILKNIMGRHPDFLRKYIKENLSKSQIDELFPESVVKEEDENEQPHNHSSASPLKHLIIALSESEDGEGTEEMFFGRLASYTASVLGLPQENVQIYSKKAINNGNEGIIKEFQEKEIDLIDRDELLFFPLRSGIVHCIQAFFCESEAIGE